jgi:hypothetical protein
MDPTDRVNKELGLEDDKDEKDNAKKGNKQWVENL